MTFKIERYECGTCGRHLWVEDDEITDYIKTQYLKMQASKMLKIKCVYCKQEMYRMGGNDKADVTVG